MTFHDRTPFSTHAIGLGDLDLQPVREAKVRVLNDIPREPTVPPLAPQVKFNFVDMTFPKSPQKELVESAQTHHGSASRSPKKRSNAEKEGNAGNQVRCNKENSYAGQAQRNMERDRREYLSQLLRRGMPVWEEVPEEEKAARVIGGTNPFRHHPYSSNPMTSNITHSTNKKKSSKLIQAVWENVQDGSKYSYPLEHSDELIGSPRGSIIEDEEIDLKSRAERRNKTLQSKSQTALNVAYDTSSYKQPHSTFSYEHHLGGHTMAPEDCERTHEPCISLATLSNDLNKGNVSQAHPTSQEQVHKDVEEYSSKVQEPPHQNPPEHLVFHEVLSPVQGGCHPLEFCKSKDGVVLEQGEVSSPVMEKIYSGRTDNNATSSISWWPGDKLYKERSKNEEEEKHEKESTKEKKGKRDLSAPPSNPQKRRHVVADQEEAEEVVKPLPRVRHYEPDEVRKYMRDKQCERAKAIKEQQRRQEQEKIQKSERMKELAMKTKQLSQVDKKGWHNSTPTGLINQEKNQLEQQPIMSWGSHKEWRPENYSEASPSHKTNAQVKEQYFPDATPFVPFGGREEKSLKQNEAKREANQVAVVPLSRTLDEDRYGEADAKNAKKRNKTDGKKRKKRQSMSDSEAISDIVSRTVEECERQVKSSSVSVESLTSLSSFSCSSSDAESRSSQSESLSSGLDLEPKERVVALGQLAQKLTSKVTQKAETLSQWEKHNQEVPDTSHKTTATNIRKQVTRKLPAKNIMMSDPRASLSLPQIESMSVEELIAKMTAMLPNKSVNESRSKAPETDLQSKNINTNEKHNFQHNTQEKTRIENMTNRHTQDNSLREGLQRALTEQVPKLVVPEIPKLKLSGGNKKVEEQQKIAQQENLSMPPGCSIVHSVKDVKSQTDEEKQIYVRMAPTHKLPNRYILPQCERLVTGRQQGQSQIFISTYRNCPIYTRKKYEQAAVVIQAAYRGYRVRKVTNSLISRQTVCKVKNINETKSFRVPSNTLSVGPRLNKFFKTNDSTTDGSNEISQKVLLKEGREQQINWREIRLELERRTLKPHKESYYVSQRSNLPGWIKPYFVLSETGDVKNFLETCIDKPEGGTDERNENRSNCNMINQGQNTTQNSHLVFEECVHDATLTEGPLLDIEKGTISCFDKETQTSYNKYINIKEDKEGSDQKSNAAKKSSEVHNFIDLKKFSRRKVISQNGENVGNTQKAESYEILSSEALRGSQSTLSQKDHEDTLEEGILEEALGGECSFQATENETFESGGIKSNLNTEKEPHMETSGVMDSSGSSSVVVEEVSAPHDLLGEGVHLGPSSLRLRLNAELMYQDTLGKALNQLHNVEQLNIINRSRQEAMALSQSLALQQQKLELTAQWNNENEMKKQEEESKRRNDYERRLKEKLKQQEAALQKVEKIEKEARSRFAELEREVRSRAEQVIAQATERVPHPSSVQSDVIATAAVAAVGATISHWKQLRPVRGHDSHDSITLSEGPLSPKPCSEQNDASYSTPLSDKSYSGLNSGKSLSKENRSIGDKMASLISENLGQNLSKTSVVEEASSGNCTNKNSEGPQVSSDIKSSQNSVPENIVSEKSSFPLVNQSTVPSEYFVKSNDNGFNKVHEKPISQGAGKILLKENEYSDSISEKIDCASGAENVVSSGEVISSSNLVSEDILSSRYLGKAATTISRNIASSATKSSEDEIVSGVKSHPQTLKSSSIRDHKKFQLNEPLPSKINNGSTLMSLTSKSREKERKKEEKDMSDIYSESFEVDSESEGSNTSQLQGRGQGACGGDLALVVSSGNIMNDLGYRSSPQGAGGVTAPVPGGGGEGALGVTLSVVESMLKEEEVHHQHQKSILKLQEQSLVEEAKWKLATLQSEGGPGMRRRQRAIVLQLREQKAYLKRLRETQNIGAQQRRLMLLQLHHLLATTKNLSGFSSKGYLTAARGHSPNPSSPRLTPRLMEMLSSSSSDAPDDATLSLLMRGRDTDSSSLSESGGCREKRRGHSEDRLKICSGRLHEKRRTVEIEALQQQILHEDKEILRLKVKSPYDIHDKDSVKPKRKGDFITKRIREKKDKNSGSVSPLSFLGQGSRTSAESSVPTETMVATAHDSQSSVPEEGGSETVSHSDVASSVSEQEGLTSTSHRIGNSQSKEVSGSKRLPSYGISERETNDSIFSIPKIMSHELESETMQEQYLGKDSKVHEKSSSVKTVSGGETSLSVEERHSHEKSERSSKSLEKSEMYEKNTKSSETSIRTKLGSSGSTKSGWNKPESVISEDITDKSKVRSASNSSWCSSETRADSGARASDSKSSEGKSSTRGLPLPLKVPLSPRSLYRQHRRYSSESDDSFTLSQTETASDASDGEGKLLALKEELAVRKAEAERLKKEKRRLRRERLTSQERALRQQISTYDAYIQHARMELEKESKELQQASMVRPLIKKPQVAETKKSRLSEPLITSPEKSDVSDASLVSEGSKSDQSHTFKSQETSSKGSNHVKPHENIKSQEFHLTQMGAASLKDQEIISSSSSKEADSEEKSSNKVTSSETFESQRESESQKTSCSSSVSDNLNEESVSEHIQDDDSKKSLSQESSIESEHTQSKASSTETIVHSPQKLEPSQNDEAAVSISEVNAALLEVLKNNEKDHINNSRSGSSDARIKVEGEKLEIFMPTSDFKYYEVEELVEGNINLSAEQSICEEVIDDNFQETENESNSQEMEISKNILHQITTESNMYEKNYTISSSLSENKEPSLKPESFTETDKPSPTLKAKDTLCGSEGKKEAPTLDRQRLVDDISNNILAIMIKDTSQLFTTIVKDKVNSSKTLEVEDDAEAFRGSIAPELPGEVSKSQKDAGSQSQHSWPIVPEEDPTSSKQNSSSKSQILQRVNELIGEGGSGSLHLPTLSSPRSVDVQLTSQLTFDLSPESTSPISPIAAKVSQVEKDELMGLFECTSPHLPDEGTAGPGVAPSESHQKEEEQHDSLSPSHDVVKAEKYKLDTDMEEDSFAIDPDTLTTRLLNLASAPELDLEARLGQLGENTEFSVEGIEGDWFDDDFWTFSDSKKKQQQLKAEEERITAEIARLEELQHLQQKYPGLVIREVPNKPPPPYTPPQVTSPPSPGSSPTPARPPAYTSPPTSPILPEAQPLSPSHSSSISHRLSKADQRKLAAHITQVVPITEEEALPIIDSALGTLFKAWQNNIDPGDIPPPPHTTLAKAFLSSNFTEEEMHEDEKTSNRAFHLLLFCLAQELLSVPYKLQHSAQPPPWIKQVLPQARVLGIVHAKSRAGLFSYVHEQVKVLFGWKLPLQKESLMIRWAQKHRDLVDQVLVKELQAEEASWTNYDEDEAAVKTKVASDILDTLLSETVALVSSILVRKLGYIVH